MKVSTKGRYALRIMTCLAKHYVEDRYISINEIAEEEGLSNKYLEQIIPLLNKRGLLDIKRGKLGGYRLSRKPKDIKAGDVLRISEGELEILFCSVSKDHKCSNYKDCLVRDFWLGLEKDIYRYVDSYTLDDIIKRKIKL